MIRTLLASGGCLLLFACGGSGGGGGGGNPFVSSAPCDAGLVLDDADPISAAEAIGICDGLVSAQWVHPDGSAATLDGNFHLGHGIISDFGANNPPREGDRVLVLSSGTARRPIDVQFQADFDKGYTTRDPAGFPFEETACPGVVAAQPHDGIALEVVLDVPDGVVGFEFDFAFFTRDHPTFVCSTAADYAAAMVIGPGHPGGGTNVLLDGSGRRMSANATPMQQCAPAPCPVGQAVCCPQGPTGLTGTGFEAGGGTGWLNTGTVSASPGDTVTIRFAIWDSGDGVQDSTLVVDGFAWIPAP